PPTLSVRDIKLLFIAATQDAVIQLPIHHCSVHYVLCLYAKQFFEKFCLYNKIPGLLAVVLRL
ncbi:hypothetical protein L9F63_001984, partial [Diploptera punctata]